MTTKASVAWQSHPFQNLDGLTETALTAALQERFRASLTVLLAAQLGAAPEPPRLSSRAVWERALPQWETWHRPEAKDYLVLQGAVWIRQALVWLTGRTGTGFREHQGKFRLVGLNGEAERRMLRILQTKGYRNLAIFTNQLELPNFNG